MHPPILFDEKIPRAQRRPAEFWAGSAGAGAGRGGDGAVCRTEDVACKALCGQLSVTMIFFRPYVCDDEAPRWSRRCL